MGERVDSSLPALEEEEAAGHVVGGADHDVVEVGPVGEAEDVEAAAEAEDVDLAPDEGSDGAGCQEPSRRWALRSEKGRAGWSKLENWPTMEVLEERATSDSVISTVG